MLLSHPLSIQGAILVSQIKCLFENFKFQDDLHHLNSHLEFFPIVLS